MICISAFALDYNGCVHIVDSTDKIPNVGVTALADSRVALK